jgi:hypothetical protein
MGLAADDGAAAGFAALAGFAAPALLAEPVCPYESDPIIRIAPNMANALRMDAP